MDEEKTEELSSSKTKEKPDFVDRDVFNEYVTQRTETVEINTEGIDSE